MLARVYLILGSILLLGYALVAFEGWEFGSAVLVSAAPPEGAALSSSGRYHSSSHSRGWIIFGPGGGK
jgi:hypothetical protein